MDQTYLPDDVYHRLVEALAELKPSVWERDKLDAEEIMERLGEIAGVWPDRIRRGGSAGTD